jgi:hypothetical protein
MHLRMFLKVELKVELREELGRLIGENLVGSSLGQGPMKAGESALSKASPFDSKSGCSEVSD